MDSEVPSDVRALLRDRIESYEQLEILLLLRSRPGESWVPHAVAVGLQMAQPLAEQELRALCRQGLLSVAISPDVLVFRYRPSSPELTSLVDELAGTYAAHRLAVMRLLTANAIERLRARALRTFSNAFLVGKKENKDG